MSEALAKAVSDPSIGTMHDSIFLSVKKVLGLEDNYDPFDQAILMHINTVFGILNQLGVGPDKPFMITGKDETWDQFITQPNTEFVRSYMYLKVKQFFDPSSTATMYEAVEEQLKELEWRLTVAVDEDELLNSGSGD